jgi:hypothetical protein
VPKKRNLHKNELNTTFFCSTSPPKRSKWLKIFKISLTFRFDKLSNSSKSVHTGENSQILTVSKKKNYFLKIHKSEYLIQFRSPYFIVLVLVKNSTNFKQIHGGLSCSIFSINHISNNPRNLNFAVNNLD